ncbi:MAG: hypothetical protein ACOYOV_10525 [Bacteroidales bacterium]
MKEKNLIRKATFFIGISLNLVLVVIFYVMTDKYILNIPHADEYGTALHWLMRYLDVDSDWGKIKILFSQANEHRIFTCYLATLSDYKIFGSLNFTRMLWYANLAMIPLVLIMISHLKTGKKNPWFMLPVMLLMFIPQAEVHNWGVVALAAVYQYIFAFLAMMLLAKQGWLSFAGAAILAFFTTFTFGNGMLIFISGYLVLAIVHPRNTIRFIGWSVAMIVIVGLYFNDFNFSAGVGFNTYFMQQPLLTLQHFLIFFGSIFHSFFPGSLNLLTVSGFVVMLAFGLLIFFKWKEIKNYPVALAMMLFIILSAGAASVNRVSMGLMSATSPRYIMYQAVFLALLYIIAIDLWKKYHTLILVLVLVASSLLYVWRLELNHQYFEYHQAGLKDQIFYYHTNFNRIKSSNPKVIKTTIDKCIKKGIYTPPSVNELYPEITSLNLEFPANYSERILYTVDDPELDSTTLVLNGWAFSENYQRKNQITIIALQSDSVFLTFSVINTKRKDVQNHFKQTYPNLHLNTGFQSHLAKKWHNIPTGKYRLGVGIAENGIITHFRLTDIEVSF